MSIRLFFINILFISIMLKSAFAFIKYHMGPINDFLGTEVVVDFPPETMSRVEKQTTTEVPRKSYRPKCGINFYHTSYKILVESITLWQRFTPTWNGYELFCFILRHIPLIAGEVVRALRHTYSLILRVNNLKKKSDLIFWPLPFWKYDKKTVW